MLHLLLAKSDVIFEADFQWDYIVELPQLIFLTSLDLATRLSIILASIVFYSQLFILLPWSFLDRRTLPIFVNWIIKHASGLFFSLRSLILHFEERWLSCVLYRKVHLCRIVALWHIVDSMLQFFQLSQLHRSKNCVMRTLPDSLFSLFNLVLRTIIWNTWNSWSDTMLGCVGHATLGRLFFQSGLSLSLGRVIVFVHHQGIEVDQFSFIFASISI